MFWLGFIAGMVVMLILVIMLGAYLSSHPGGAGLSESDLNE